MESLTTRSPDEQHTNGRVTEVPRSDARGNMISNRTPWIELPDPFDNLSVRVWLDYPHEIAMLWTTPAPKADGAPSETPEEGAIRVREACKAVFLDHRGVDGGPWEDEDGTLPSPDTDEFWERVPNALVRAMIACFFEEMNESPLSRRSRKKKRASWKRR